MDDWNVLATALTLGASMEVDHHGPRASIGSEQQGVDLEAIEAPVGGLDRFHEPFELIVLADARPAAAGGPFVNLGRTRWVLPTHKRGRVVLTPAQVIALRSGDVGEHNAFFPVDVLDARAAGQVDDSDAVVNTFVHHHDRASPCVIDGATVDVVLLVDEPSFDHVRLFRIDLGKPHEIAAAGIGQREHPACRPPDLAHPPGVRQEPGHSAVSLEDMWFRPTSKYLADDGPSSVGTPILPVPIIARSRPGDDFARHQVQLAQADIAPAAGVPAEADASAVRMQRDALMDGLRV